MADCAQIENPNLEDSVWQGDPNGFAPKIGLIIDCLGVDSHKRVNYPHCAEGTTLSVSRQRCSKCRA